MSSNRNGERASGTAAAIGRYGARGAGSVISAILKILGTVILIIITSALLFTCIFVVYIKTNLSKGLDVTPDEMTLNLSSVIYSQNPDTGSWEELAVLTSEETRFWVDYEDIPIDFEHAVIAVEDQRFYRHHGVDWYRTGGAFFNMFISTRNTFGGSTLTQQLIKNVTGNNDPTVQRKLKEILMALEFEKNYTKEDIVEYYLNVVYFGHGCYGIGAAADYYFGKEVGDLSVAEMAAIVGITNNPSLYSPFVSRDNNKERQEIILRLMYEQGYLDYDTYTAAKDEELVFTRGENEAVQTTVYSYFVDAVIEDAIDTIMEQRECSRKIASQLLFNSGYQIYATIDRDIQAKVDSIYTDLTQIPKPNGNKQLQSAIVITDPYTGDVLAMAGGVGEKTISRGLNRATQSKRAPGSSIKPIAVYAPAMEYGYITPDTKFDDSADVKLTGIDWLPKNDNRSYSGIVDIRTALRRSINTVSAQIMDLLTPQVSYDFLTEKLHITTLVENREGKTDIGYAPLCLGQLTDGVHVREMAAAYSMFVNSGVYTEARTFTKICDSDGVVIYENTPETEAAISEKVAYWMTVMLHDAAVSGTGSEANLGSLMPTAGKTGTSGDSNDRWFCGYTPYYAAAVWCGYDTPSKISISGNPSAQLWKKVMKLVHEDLEYREFSKPADTKLTPVHGVNVTTCTVRGVLADGTVIYEQSHSYASGRDETIAAPEVEGYTLADAAEKTADDSTDVLDFLFVSDTPAETEPPENPEGTELSETPENPGGTGTPENPNTPENPGAPDETPVVPPPTEPISTSLMSPLEEVPAA